MKKKVRYWTELYTTNGVYLVTAKGKERKPPFMYVVEMIIEPNTKREEKVWALSVEAY